MKRVVAIFLGVCFFAAAGIVQAQDFQIVVNKANSASSISKSELKKIFTKKQTKWDDGTKVEPVDLAASAPAREAFSKAVHGKNTSAMKSYWQRKVFSGRGSPPPERDSDAAVIQYVKSNAGAVGYVSGSASVDGVKVLGVN